MLRLIAPLTTVLALASPGLASAGVAQTRIDDDVFGSVPVSHVEYLATEGERNRVTVDRLGPGEWGMRDTGATMTARDGCVLVNAHAVRCSAITTAMGSAEVAAGDEADTVTIDPQLAAVVRGGTGDDVLRGAGHLAGEAGDDTISTNALLERRGNDVSGGPGRDILNGGGVGDRLDGGAGDDRIDGGAGADSLDGGKGRDRIIGRSGPDLLVGGSGADLLVGGDGDDRLEASTSGDRAFGGAGDDELDGDVCCRALGGVSLFGGPGNDVLSLNRRPVAVSCGRGRDVLRVLRSFRAAVLSRARGKSCERLRVRPG